VGYEVLWRAASSPDWEHVLNVGKQGQVTVKISKDHVICAVRAVEQGRRSLPVVPLPER
jgi:hypothetical protein